MTLGAVVGPTCLPNAIKKMTDLLYIIVPVLGYNTFKVYCHHCELELEMNYEIWPISVMFFLWERNGFHWENICQSIREKSEALFPCVHRRILPFSVAYLNLGIVYGILGKKEDAEKVSQYFSPLLNYALTFLYSSLAKCASSVTF